MDLIVPFCGSAKTSLHNQVMLEGVKSALFAALGTSSAGVAAVQNNQCSFSAEAKANGLKALGRVYAGWGFSQAFYREKLHETALGFKDLDDCLVNFWEKWAGSKDPENMLVMAHTWQAADVSQQEPYNGDFKRAMQGIKAKALVLPAKTDLYFPPEDSEIEVQSMRPGIGELKVFPTIWGHWAGGPGGSPDDVKWLDDNLREFFAKN
jgi:homoserine O-acetyltransferase